MNLNMYFNANISILLQWKSFLSRAIQHAMEKYLSENLASFKTKEFLLFSAEKWRNWTPKNSMHLKMKHKHIK